MLSATKEQTNVGGTLASRGSHKAGAFPHHFATNENAPTMAHPDKGSATRPIDERTTADQPIRSYISLTGCVLMLLWQRTIYMLCMLFRLAMRRCGASMARRRWTVRSMLSLMGLEHAGRARTRGTRQAPWQGRFGC